MRKRLGLVVIPAVLIMVLAFAAPASADFVCPVLPVSDQGAANSQAGFFPIADGGGGRQSNGCGESGHSSLDSGA